MKKDLASAVGKPIPRNKHDFDGKLAARLFRLFDQDVDDVQAVIETETDPRIVVEVRKYWDAFREARRRERIARIEAELSKLADDDENDVSNEPGLT